MQREDAGDADAAGVVESTPLAQLLQPGPHDLPTGWVLANCGCVHYVAQIQQMGTCTPAPMNQVDHLCSGRPGKEGCEGSCPAFKKDTVPFSRRQLTLVAG